MRIMLRRACIMKGIRTALDAVGGKQGRVPVKVPVSHRRKFLGYRLRPAHSLQNRIHRCHAKLLGMNRIASPSPETLKFFVPCLEDHLQKFPIPVSAADILRWTAPVPSRQTGFVRVSRRDDLLRKDFVSPTVTKIVKINQRITPAVRILPIGTRLSSISLNPESSV